MIDSCIIVDGKPVGPSALSLVINAARQRFSFEDFCGLDITSRSTQQGYLEITTNQGAADNESINIPVGGWTGAGELTIPDDSAGTEQGAAFRQQSNVILANGWLGKLAWGTKCRLDELPVAGQIFELYGGFMQPESAQRLSSDGVYFLASSANVNWILRHARAGANTELDTGILIAVDTDIVLEFEVDVAAGTVTGIIDGAGVGTITPVSIQPDQDTTSNLGMHASAAVVRAAAVQAFCDYIAWGVDLP